MTGTTAPFPRPGVETQSTDLPRWVRNIARTVNQLLQGHFNCTLTVTLAASAASTTVIDARISLQTFCGLMPQTAHAAAEIAAGGLYLTPSKGQVVIAHANNTQTDRTFTMSLIG